MNLGTIITIVASVLGGISTIVGTIVAVVKWFSKQSKKIIEGVLTEMLQEKITPHMQEIDKNISSLQAEVSKNERDRLRSHIIDFSERLRAGEVPTETSFQSIFAEHDKYHSLGGNGFETACMVLIREKYDEYYMKKESK